MNTTKHTNLETATNKSIVVLARVVLSFVVAQNAMAQDFAAQNLNLAANAVYQSATSGNPGAMIITTGTAGDNALTSVADVATNYSITQNFASTVKITANPDDVLPAGNTLQINLESLQELSAGDVEISATSPASASSVVTLIQRGAEANKTITCTFGANASAGVPASTARVVTLTSTN